MYRGMIVDDAAIMRMRLREILDPHFEIVSEAGDGEEALMNYELASPDFVTLDITMPKMNGIETLKNIVKKYPNAKVVIVSAVGQKKLVFEALSTGAKDFIVKPFDPERVKQSIFRLFE